MYRNSIDSLKRLSLIEAASLSLHSRKKLTTRLRIKVLLFTTYYLEIDG
jgi:hypothetical protein